jgi:hypothetical protein
LNNLLMMKFGGTSVGSAERMRVAARISADLAKSRPVAIVVSAMSRITDLLLDTMRHAEADDGPGVEANIRKLRERHLETCIDLLPADRTEPVLRGIHDLIGEFERITGGMRMLGERPPRSVDEAVAIGERLSAAGGGIPGITGARRGSECSRDRGRRRRLRHASPLMDPTREKAAFLIPHLEGRTARNHGIQWRDGGRTADHAGTRRIGFSASILSAALDAAGCGSGPTWMGS